MTRIEKRFVNELGHSRRVAEEAVRRLRLISVQSGWSYLDVGCGNGAAALHVADTFGVHVVGVDVDPQQIALARSAAGGRTDVLFMTADATSLPFEDGRFDIVATNKTTHHVPQWLSAIAERMDPFAELRGWLQPASGAGLLLFLVLFLVLNTASVPAPVLGAVSGATFGPVSGAAITLVTLTITAGAQFFLARHVVGEWVRQRLGHAFVRVSDLLERRGVIAVAGARLLPGPFSELNMLAGPTSLTLRDFMIGTFLGCIPKALAWSGIGALFF